MVFLFVCKPPPATVVGVRTVRRPRPPVPNFKSKVECSWGAPETITASVIWLQSRLPSNVLSCRVNLCLVGRSPPDRRGPKLKLEMSQEEY